MIDVKGYPSKGENKMKEYVKPDLFYESFELSQHIAACGIDVNFENTTKCQPTLDQDETDLWPGLGGTTVFADGEDRCAIKTKDIEVYCYTVGTSEAGRTFNS